MSRILGYGCVTLAGQGVPALWEALRAGVPLTDREIEMQAPATCAHLVLGLRAAYREALATASLSIESTRLGVIFASTKGALEDTVWGGADPLGDSLSPVLDQFLIEEGIHPARRVCLSNACASSVAAIALADVWLARGLVDRVLVLAADRPGPFVRAGFESLRAVSSGVCRPFSAARDGLRLGEAEAALILGPDQGDGLTLKAVLDTEGFAVTRADPSGDSLVRAYQSLNKVPAQTIDLVVAHGTATASNDQVEDAAFSKMFGSNCPPITATKWCIGHTLGASALIDTIAACEVLRTQEIFSIATTEARDPAFQCQGYRLGATQNSTAKIDRVLLSSLGFGGTHGLAVVSRGDPAGPKDRTPVPDELGLAVRWISSTCVYPPKTPPPWAESVDRWYQLDPPAYRLTELFWQHLRDSQERPSAILVASAGGSYETDRAFAATLQSTGVASAQKFVHTLPNIRSSPLFQLMKWSGPMLCVVDDPRTLLRALEVASDLMRSGPALIWIFANHGDEVRWFECRKKSAIFAENAEYLQIPGDMGDLDFVNHLNEIQGVRLPGGCGISLEPYGESVV